MNDGLQEAFRYNAWATENLLAFLSNLDDAQLTTTATGSYGSILDTLNHMLGAENYYLYFLTGERLTWDWQLDGNATVDQLATSARDLAAGWTALRQKPIDFDALIERPSSRGPRIERAGIVITQAIHHGNVHREQVNMILTTQGIKPPDLDVWMYDRSFQGPLP